MRTKYLDMAREHWAQYRPKMVEELKKAGKLEEELVRAATKASDLVFDLVDTMNLMEAEEIALPRYILLPSEEDVPLLGEGERDPETSVLMDWNPEKIPPKNTPAPYPKGTRFGPLARPEWPPDYDPDDEEELMMVRVFQKAAERMKKAQQ